MRITIMFAGATLVCSSALAGTATTNLTVNASVSAVCSITSNPVAFGAYDPVTLNATSELDGTGSVVVSCTKGASATIDFDKGKNFGNNFRRMSGTGDFLQYSLFKDAGHTQNWGTAVPGGTTAAYASASVVPATLTVYGAVSPGQDIKIGSYSDTVVATINY